MILIEMVTALDCPVCLKVKQRIRALLDNNGIEAEIREHDSDSEEAVSLAIASGLDSVPSFVVNTVAFNDENFDAKEFVDAARKVPA
jgi:hypothetical protein